MTKRRSAPRAKRIAAVLAGTAFALVTTTAGTASAASDTVEAMGRVGEQIFDLAVLRPLSAIALAAGSVFFVGSVPLVAPYGAVKGSFDGVRGAWSTFVYAPYDYTLRRELGEF
jgi:hypothetical protein